MSVCIEESVKVPEPYDVLKDILSMKDRGDRHLDLQAFLQDEDLEEDPDDDLDVFGNNGLNTSPLHFNTLLMTSTSV